MPSPLLHVQEGVCQFRQLFHNSGLWGAVIYHSTLLVTMGQDNCIKELKAILTREQRKEGRGKKGERKGKGGGRGRKAKGGRKHIQLFNLYMLHLNGQHPLSEGECAVKKGSCTAPTFLHIDYKVPTKKKNNTNNACRKELWKNGTKKINDSTNTHMYMYPSGYLTEPALLISTDGPPGKKPSTDPAQHKLIYQSP